MFRSTAYNYPADIGLLMAQLDGKVTEHGKTFVGEIVSISLRGSSNRPGGPPLGMILEVVWALRPPPSRQTIVFPQYQPAWNLYNPLRPIPQAVPVITGFPPGYGPSLITAVSNPFGTIQFAVVLEELTLTLFAAVQASGFPYLVYGLPPSADVDPSAAAATTFELMCQNANALGYVARSITSYTQMEQFAFAVTFWPAGYGHTPDFTGWSVDVCTSADLQPRLNAFRQTTPWPPRPEMVCVTRILVEDGPPIDLHGVLWHDNLLRGPDGAWELHWGIDEATYNGSFRNGVPWGAATLWPIRVQANGQAPNVVYDVLLAGDDRAQARIASPPEYAHTASDPVDYFASVDSVIVALMRSQGARGAQLAIAIDDRLVCSKAYTWAEASYPLVTLDKRFRVGSTSKVLTALTTLWTFEQVPGRWPDIEAALYDPIVNNWPAALASPCPDLKTVTVAGLTTHSAGLDTPDIEPNSAPLVFAIQDDRRSGTGPYGQGSIPIQESEARQDALTLATLVSPVQGFFSYSNQSPTMLGYYIENLFGQGVGYEFLVTQMLMGVGLLKAGTDDGAIGRGAPNSADAHFHDLYPQLTNSVLDANRPLTLMVYGGYDFQVFRAAGGWMMKTQDLVMVLAGLWGSIKALPRRLPLSNAAANLALTPNVMQSFPGGLPGAPPVVAYSFGGLQVNNLIGGDGGGLRYVKNGVFYGCAAMLGTRADGVSVALTLNQQTWGGTLGDLQFVQILAKVDAVRAAHTLPKGYDLFHAVNA